MACKARVYSDGSWVCTECRISGDADEDVEDYCHMNTTRGLYVGNRSPSDQDGLEERLNAHAAKNRERAKRK